MLKKVWIHTRRGIKITILLIIAAFLITGVIAFLYKPTYSVFINGEQVGYTENKSKLQHKINEYVEKGVDFAAKYTYDNAVKVLKEAWPEVLA